MKRTPKTDWLSCEDELRYEGFQRVVGLDEAGCGPLAGPVVAACVLLPSELELPALNDSKKLSEKVRLELYAQIVAEAEFAVGIVEAEDIDRLNIRQATYLAMQRAVEALTQKPDFLLVDCWRLAFWTGAQRGLVGGDAQVRSIAAASIVAKTTRDRIMIEAAEQYPRYEFERHKGYPTARHYELLRQYGSCPLHRQSFLGKLRNLELGVSSTEEASR